MNRPTGHDDVGRGAAELEALCNEQRAERLLPHVGGKAVVCRHEDIRPLAQRPCFKARQKPSHFSVYLAEGSDRRRGADALRMGGPVRLGDPQQQHVGLETIHPHLEHRVDRTADQGKPGGAGGRGGAEHRLDQRREGIGQDIGVVDQTCACPPVVEQKGGARRAGAGGEEPLAVLL